MIVPPLVATGAVHVSGTVVIVEVPAASVCGTEVTPDSVALDTDDV